VVDDCHGQLGRGGFVKTLVAYVSLTGNTRKVAEAIYAGLPEEKELKELDAVKDLDEYRISFIGFPIHAHGPAKEASEFLEAHAEGRPVALFVTHATPEEAPDLSQMIQNCVNAAAGAQVLGVFNCQGELAQDVIEHLQKSNHPQMRLFGEQGNYTKGQPDASRLERAGAFARQIMQKIG
jgi:flavodoxin